MWMTFTGTWSPGPVFISANFPVTPGGILIVNTDSSRSSAGTVPTWQGYVSYDNGPFTSFTSVLTSPVNILQNYNFPITIPPGARLRAGGFAASQARISFYNMSFGSNDMGWINPVFSVQPPSAISCTYAIQNIALAGETINNITLTDNTYIVSGGPIPTLLPGQTNNTTFTGTYGDANPPYPAHQVMVDGTTIGYGPVNLTEIKTTVI